LFKPEDFLKILHFITDRIYHISIGIIVCGAICAWSWDLAETRAAHNRPKSVSAITESIRITKADGAKSLAQLIRELPPASASIPDQAIKSFYFIVSPFDDGLIFPNVEGFQPPGFSWGILPGQDKRFEIPEIELKGAEALNFFLVQSQGKACNFLLIIEFYPR
jgi:hypothetical protein